MGALCVWCGAGAWITFSCFGDWESSVLLSEVLLRAAKRRLCLADLSRPVRGGSSTILAWGITK